MHVQRSTFNSPSHAPSQPVARRLCRAVAAVLAATAFLHAQAAVPAASFRVVAQPMSLPAGDAVAGALPANATLHVVVALRLRDVAGLDAFIASESVPMPHATFLALHAPTAAQAQAVADFLAARGLHAVQISADRMLVSADGSAAAIAAAFGTAFVQVRTHDGSIAYANADAVRVPAALGDSVLAVAGLQNVQCVHAFVQRGVAGNGDPAITAHDPAAFAAIYGGSGVAAASNIAVGIVAGGAPARAMADVNAFAGQHGWPAPRTLADGSIDATTDAAVWNVASQGVLGMAGGRIGALDFHAAADGSAASLLATYDAIVSQDRERVIVLPFGRCEADALADGSAAADDALFAAAAAQGQTFVAASGGATACAGAAWPAASRYVVAVGGTQVATAPDATAWAGEVSWAAGHASASRFEPAAPWQRPSSDGHRVAADVAYPADPASGARILVQGANATFGGTGLSAALFAGAWARVLQAHPQAGFAGTSLARRTATDFHAITGADAPAMGRGSPIITALVADASVQANQPPVAAFSFTTTGLTGHFTDSSTDSDGSVVSHKWTFGDGGTASSPNPNHPYATAGTYSVTETVRDDGGATNAQTQTVKVPFSEQLLLNPGFEKVDPRPWKIQKGTGIFVTDSSLAHGGSKLAAFGGPPDTTQAIIQQVAVPAGIHSAKLTFYIHITTTEPPNRLGDDYLRVCLGTQEICGVQFTGKSASSGYVLKELNLNSNYFGATVPVKFYSVEARTGNGGTHWYVDDIKLTVR